MSKEIFVFDMGNVITRPSRLRGIYYAAEMKCSYEEFKHYFYHSKENDDVCKGLIEEDEFFNFIKDITGTKRTGSELKKFYYLNKGGIYFDTMYQINKLKTEGNKVCLLSNLKPIDFKYLSSNTDITLFDKLFLSYKLGMIKPDEEIFKYVIEELNTNKFHFFDDTYTNIEVARKLGIDAHQVTGKNISEHMKKIKSRL